MLLNDFELLSLPGDRTGIRLFVLFFFQKTKGSLQNLCGHPGRIPALHPAAPPLEMSENCRIAKLEIVGLIVLLSLFAHNGIAPFARNSADAIGQCLSDGASHMHQPLIPGEFSVIIHLPGRKENIQVMVLYTDTGPSGGGESFFTINIPNFLLNSFFSFKFMMTYQKLCHKDTEQSIEGI